MKKNTPHRLVLNRETLHRLDPSSLQGAAGAADSITGPHCPLTVTGQTLETTGGAGGTGTQRN